MREIALDTETTGLNPMEGDRVIEIGCVELMNGIPTGEVYHAYINPERDVPPQASAISGLTTDFLKPYPKFAEVVDDFLTFIADSTLIIHNAAFDMGFLNAELGRAKKPLLKNSRVVDTLKLARSQFPGSPASLDALCRRFRIDLSGREKHGALIDAQLLARVYLELTGGRQTTLAFQNTKKAKEQTPVTTASTVTRVFREPRAFPPTPEELKDHEALLDTIKSPLWREA